jgi:hypothetical protein
MISLPTSYNDRVYYRDYNVSYVQSIDVNWVTYLMKVRINELICTTLKYDKLSRLSLDY